MPIISKVLSFQGRLGCVEYWIYGYVPLLIVGAATQAVGPDPAEIGHVDLPWSTLIVNVGAAIVAIWANLAAGVRRCHDHGKSGWWMGIFASLAIIPLVNFWPLIELGFLSGTPTENEFGKPPSWPGSRKAAS